MVYYDKFVRHIDAIPVGGGSEGGRKGKPVAELNHQFEKGPVFDSGKNRGICLHMTGFFYFPETGVYTLTALSNDGIRISLDGKTVINDPTVHSDRYSNRAIVRIDRKGWYPIEVLYFQRKGTAALKLFWKKAASAEFEVVPAGAFGHLMQRPKEKTE